MKTAILILLSWTPTSTDVDHIGMASLQACEAAILSLGPLEPQETIYNGDPEGLIIGSGGWRVVARCVEDE